MPSKFYSLPQALELVSELTFPTTTTGRWVKVGVSGTKLNAVKIGGVKKCTLEEAHRFLSLTTSGIPLRSPSEIEASNA